MRPKALFKDLADRLGYEVIKSASRHGENIDVLDLAVQCHLTKFGSPCLLQVGANDGVLDDAIRPLILKYGLSGLLVEPMPHRFQQLQHNYQEFPKIKVENCALSDSDGTRNLYRIREATEVPKWAFGVASFQREVLVKHKKQFAHIENYIEALPVQTLTIQTLLEKHGISDVDFLQVDTEGYDGEIVKMCLRAGLRPRIINYEYVHLSVGQQQECRDLLARQGYRFLNISKDTLALRDL